MKLVHFFSRSIAPLALLAGLLLMLLPPIGLAFSGSGAFAIPALSGAPHPTGHTVSLTSAVSVTYDENIDSTTVNSQTFAVHAMQSGLLGEVYSVSGGEIKLTPNSPFKPGELVQVSATTGTLSLGGQAPISPTVWHFNPAATGGSAIFTHSGQSFPSSGGQGVSLGDVDGDGDVDAFVTSYYANALWLNEGSGQFSDSDQSLGGSRSAGVALGDVDGDGDLDAFVANGINGGQANKVWRNDGNGAFTDSGQNLGTSQSLGVALGDVDGDGDLDAFVANGHATNQANKVWLNDGMGNFSDSGQSLGNSKSRGVALGDVDGDGDLDTFVANGRTSAQANKVWLNDGSGTFSESQSLGSSISGDVALGDVDGDGDLDAFIANGVFSSQASKVWRNNGLGVFTDSGQSLGSSESAGVALGDMDGDGDLDAFISNGVSSGQPHKIWWNNGSGTFADSGQSLGNNLGGRRVALADLDQDGDLDAFVSTWSRPEEVWLNQNSQLLAIYALSFDNRPTSKHNLAPYYPDTLQGIVEATENEPDKTAVILADLDGVVGDTEIVVAQNGVATTIPVADVLGQGPEYDMTDANTLGEFVRWAKESYPADKSTFSYVGHGTFLAADTDVSEVFNYPVRAHMAGDPLFPLPTRKNMHPDFTDHDPVGLISPHDLAEAMRIGTEDGSNPFTVLDLTHCFAASIEEFYELSNAGGTPYAQVMIGSPNYMYFGPEMAGDALSAVQPSDSSTQMASAILGAYESVLHEADLSDNAPDVDHPRIIVAVESSKIPPIKQSMDQLSAELMTSFGENAADTKSKILAAYTNSAKYDTTFCAPQDWELAPGDALSDLADFADKLSAAFGPSSDVSTHATNVTTLTHAAVVASQKADGTPWFADPLTPHWSFPGAGLSLYTDFQGVDVNGSTTLSWQAHWYTATVSDDNPNPYAFVQGEATWADVFERFWLGEELETAACMPKWPSAKRPGELSAIRIVEPASNRLTLGVPVPLTVEMSSNQVAYNPLVHFRVQQNGVTVFSDTVGTGHLVTGTHQIEASRAWIPTKSGPFALDVFVDSDDRVEETNEHDNRATMNGLVESSNANIWISPPLTTTMLSDLVTVEIRADNLQNLYGAQLELAFDPSILEVVDAYSSVSGVQIEDGTFLVPDTTISNSADNSNGTIKYSISLLGSKPGVSGSGTLARITFRTLTTGNSPITLTNVVLSDPQSGAIEATQNNGQIIVEEEPDPPAITGRAFLSGQDNHAGIDVCLGSTCVQTSAHGSYTLTDVPPSGTLDFSHPNYLSTNLDYDAPAGEVTTLPDVYLQQATLSVIGKVTLERRQSNAGVEVCAHGTCVTTTSDGLYTLTNLPLTGSVEFSRQSYLSSTLDYEGEGGEVITLDVTLLGGDANQDGIIDILDATIIANAWNSTPSDDHWDARADITGDGVVDMRDMVAVQFNWEESNGSGGRAHQPARANAQTAQTQVLISPTSSKLSGTGESVEMELIVEQVSNLYSFSIVATFDPTLLQARDADPRTSQITEVALGDFLDPSNHFVLVNRVDNQAGTIELSVTQIHPAQAKSGSGLLGTITFDSIAEGSSNLRLTNLQLVDDTTPDPQLIPANTQNGKIVIGQQRIYLPLMMSR
ncbi:MAG: FG-GAP-like repeat-containing protein [Ardenticatenaceae bacterium]